MGGKGQKIRGCRKGRSKGLETGSGRTASQQQRVLLVKGVWVWVMGATSLEDRKRDLALHADEAFQQDDIIRDVF